VERGHRRSETVVSKSKDVGGGEVGDVAAKSGALPGIVGKEDCKKQTGEKEQSNSDVAWGGQIGLTRRKSRLGKYSKERVEASFSPVPRGGFCRDGK